MLLRIAVDAELQKIKDSRQELEAELDRLRRALDDLDYQRGWVVTQARKRLISERVMESQLEEIANEEAELRKEQGEKAALNAYRDQVEDLASFAEAYLGDIRAGLTWLNQDTTKLEEDQRKAIFEEKYAVVHTLVDKIVMHKDWPPEVVFVIKLDPSIVEGEPGVSSESNASQRSGRPRPMGPYVRQ